MLIRVTGSLGSSIVLCFVPVPFESGTSRAGAARLCGRLFDTFLGHGVPYRVHTNLGAKIHEISFQRLEVCLFGFDLLDGALRMLTTTRTFQRTPSFLLIALQEIARKRGSKTKQGQGKMQDVDAFWFYGAHSCRFFEIPSHLRDRPVRTLPGVNMAALLDIGERLLDAS
jgi:hypothetical protein